MSIIRNPMPERSSMRDRLGRCCARFTNLSSEKAPMQTYPSDTEPQCLHLGQVFQAAEMVRMFARMEGQLFPEEDDELVGVMEAMVTAEMTDAIYVRKTPSVCGWGVLVACLDGGLVGSWWFGG